MRLEPLILKPNPCGNSKNVLILTPPAEPNLQTSHQNCLAIVEANTQARDCQDPATVDNLCYNLNSASLHLVGMRLHVGGHNSWCDSGGGCCWRGDNSSALALDSQHQHRPATSLIIISLQTPTSQQAAVTIIPCCVSHPPSVLFSVQFHTTKAKFADKQQHYCWSLWMWAEH